MAEEERALVLCGETSRAIALEGERAAGRCDRRGGEERGKGLAGRRLKLWNRLPQELLVRILAFLPVHKLLELHTVCKAWRSLLQSSLFLQVSSEVGPRESWFVLRRDENAADDNRELVMFCPTSKRWFHYPLPFRTEKYDTCGIGSAGGLICYRENQETVLVFNILTKARRRLTRPPVPEGCKLPSRYFTLTMIAKPETGPSRYFTLTMIAKPETGFYQVIFLSKETCLVGGMNKWRYMHVYDSRTGNWEWKVRDFSSSTAQSPRQGDLFLFNKYESALLAYHAEDGMWSRVETPRPSCTMDGVRIDWGSLVSETVLKCKGRLLLVAALQLKGTIYGIGVWEWQFISHEGGGRWTGLAKTPRELWKPCRDHDYSTTGYGQIGHVFNFSVADDNLICVTGYEWTSKVNFCSPVTYNLDHDSWQRFPPYKDKVDYLGLFTLEPRWNALV